MLVFNVLFQTKFSNQILTRKQLFDFAEANFDGVTSFFVDSVEVVSNTGFLESWFATSSTFKGTRSHHQFISNSSSLSLTRKKTSYPTHSKKVSLAEGGSSKVQTTIEHIKPGKFYVCQFDNDWYFCVANYVSSEHGDVNMKFLHPKGPSERIFSHNVTMSVGFWLRMYTVKLLHLQLAVLDRLIVWRKRQWKILKAVSIKTRSSIVYYYLSSYFSFNIFIFF